MNLAKTLANDLREAYFGKNWTAVNLKDSLSGLEWEQALIKQGDCNNIATLVYHINYYVVQVTGFLEGGPFESKDSESFSHPEITSQIDWNTFIEQCWRDAAKFANCLEQVPEEKFHEVFIDEKYGSYYRNLEGIISHLYYHLGQIVILRKLMNK